MHRNDSQNRSRERQQKQMHYSPNLISTINNAINLRKKITIEYDSREKGITHRDIEPMGIVYRQGKRNLVGWCLLRNDWRTFRMDRLNCIKVNLKQDFIPRDGFNIEDFEDNEAPHEGEAYDDEDEIDPGKKYGNSFSAKKLNFSSQEPVKQYTDNEKDLMM